MTDPFTDAPCRREVNRGNDLWFTPEPQGGRAKETPTERADRVATAIAICNTCPLIDLCAERAREIEATDGVWAGVDMDPTHPPVRPSCGKPSGRQAHRRHHEPVCDDCRDAWNTYKNDRRHNGQEHGAA